MTTLEKLVEYGVDLEEVKNRFCGDFDLYLNCINIMIEENHIEKLKKEIKEERISDAFKTAHGLKGVIGNLAFKKLYELIYDLVEDLRVNKKDDLNKKFDLCYKEYNCIKEIVSSK